jgi:hypothetical protein
MLALALVPLATGWLVVTYQDATMTHYPARAVVAEQLRAGEVPFVHPGASCGQPLAGNPNFGVFFPDTLLLLALPLPVAFGLRFALILFLGWTGARRWARAEGAPREAAEIAATAFVLSGVFLSTWRFFNSGLALAIAPWVLAAVAKLVERARAGDGAGARRTAAELGLWGGLELLAGEPVIALLTAVVAGGRSAAVLLPAAAPGARRAGAASLAGGAVLAGLLAAPQIAATLQILPDSSRERRPFPFAIATGTSVHPARLLEQVVPFPFGRPDRRGPTGFDGHRYFGNHAPYLWTLHLGLPVLGLIALFGRPRSREEWLFLSVAAGAAALSLGRFLPGAKALYPLLSVGGRIRFPVKWWYVVALCLVPVVAAAARRFGAGERPPRSARAAATVLLVSVVALLAVRMPPTTLGLAGPLASAAALAGLIVFTRGGRRPGPAALALAIALPLAISNLPLLLAVLDRPPPAPPPVGPGRIYSRLSEEAHPRDLPAGEEAVRIFFRRATSELWPLTAALSGVGYAFDHDPDGAYGDDDRAMRKTLDARPWPERAATLRIAGVSSVVTAEPLPLPYREVAFLNKAGGVRLYALDSPTPSVRLATRVFLAAEPDAVLALHARSGFDPTTDVVLPGEMALAAGPAAPGARVVALRESAAWLEAEVETPADAVLVWSRSFLTPWRATIDGGPVPTLLADGHLVGVPVPAGRHRVAIAWSGTWVAGGALLALLGLAGGAWLRRPASTRLPHARA